MARGPGRSRRRHRRGRPQRGEVECGGRRSSTARRQGDLRHRRRHRPGRRRRDGRAGAARARPHRHPRQQRRHQYPQTAAGARARGMGQRDQDQPHQRVPVLAGGLPRHEGRRRRQDHQYRLDDVDLRRQLRAGLCREQGRHRAVHPLLRGGVGPRQHPGQCGAAGLDRYRSDQTRPRRDRRTARQGAGPHAGGALGRRSAISPGLRYFSVPRPRTSSPAPRSPSTADFP